MLGSPCSPCCPQPPTGDVCLVFTGSGFDIPTTWQIQDINGNGIVDVSSATFNTKWYGRVPAADIVLAYSRSVIGVDPFSDGLPANTGILPVWGDAMASSAVWYGQVQSCLSTHQASGRHGVNSGRLQYRFNAANGPSSQAFVDLTVAGFSYRRQYTVATLPNVGDEITFTPQDVITSAQGTAGTVAVRRLNTSNREPRASVFQAANEVQLRLNTRGQSQTISFARTSEVPSCYPFFAMPDYSAPRYAAAAIFKHTDQQYGASWIVTVEPRCSWFGKLEVQIFGTLPLPGDPNPNNAFEDFDYISFDGKLSNTSGGAAPHSFHNDYEAAVFGDSAFPVFPITLWSNQASWKFNNFGYTVPLDPFVSAQIVGVL